MEYIFAKIVELLDPKIEIVLGGSAEGSFEAMQRALEFRSGTLDLSGLCIENFEEILDHLNANNSGSVTSIDIRGSNIIDMIIRKLPYGVIMVTDAGTFNITSLSNDRLPANYPIFADWAISDVLRHYTPLEIIRSGDASSADMTDTTDTSSTYIDSIQWDYNDTDTDTDTDYESDIEIIISSPAPPLFVLNPQPREPITLSKWYAVCKTEFNVITQEPWTQDDLSNDIVYIKTGARVVDCYSVSDLVNIANNSTIMVDWEERQGQTNNAADMRQGKGFQPKLNSTQYIKLLPDYQYYVTIPSIKNMINSTKRKFELKSLGRQRIGNAKGSPGVSQIHGQGPPFPETFEMIEADYTPEPILRETVRAPAEQSTRQLTALQERISRARRNQTRFGRI
jgi:hypothetical protein